MTATSQRLIASADTVTQTFRKDVQGIRALAVTMVVLYHAGGILPGGFVGVDVFFVVSGFVITGLLSREFADDGNIRLRTFYARRARRLLPAVALMSIVVLLASAIISSPFTAQGNVGLS
jgi:peptidoglycan/LPS O-acetylase OafA/YrhL